jgi:hypothetical protein
VERFHRRRLASTYVDIDPDGSVTVPCKVIASEELEGVVEVLARELAFCETKLRGATPSSLAEALARMRDSDEGREMRSLIAENDSVAAWRSPSRHAPDSPLMTP